MVDKWLNLQHQLLKLEELKVVEGAWTATSGTLTLDEETPVYAAPDKDSGAVSTLPAGDVDWDKYEILPDGNWYSFVKDGQRYYISYSDVGH